jgi:hypothetical protein
VAQPKPQPMQQLQQIQTYSQRDSQGNGRSYNAGGPYSYGNSGQFGGYFDDYGYDYGGQGFWYDDGKTFGRVHPFSLIESF